MAKHPAYQTHLAGHALSAETLMMSYGYNPQLSEGAIKPPIFLSSTFVFQTAEEGKHFFNVVSGRVAPKKTEKNGLVYSRFNHPNSEILEDRLAYYEGAADAAVFSSGMAAITTSLLAVLQPGDVLLHSQPLYGGTETFFLNHLKKWGIDSIGFADACRLESIEATIAQLPSNQRIGAIFVESPANPTNELANLTMLSQVAQGIAKRQGHKPYLICDNTLLGPILQQPLQFGADLSIYSLTKYIGGHSDVVAGAAVGEQTLIKKIKSQRSAIGTQLDAHSCWLLSRSLETLSLRILKAQENASILAKFLTKHPKIKAVQHLDLLPKESLEYTIYQKQAKGAGSTFSIQVGDNEAAAFRFLNHLAIFKLAVSLGGTESLACHPASTTHSGIDKATRKKLGITDNLVRLSIGIENSKDLQLALNLALQAV